MDNLSQRFGTRWVLTRLNLRLAAGARLLLTGDNGAGKTTLLRILATALRPSRGQLRLFDEVVWPPNRHVRARLALMSHQHYLYEALSAVENLLLVQRLAQGGGRLAEIGEVLHKVGLTHEKTAPVATFSAGMKRRLVLARVLLLRPELVLLDEPLAHLDPPGQNLVLDLIAQMAQAKTTLVIASHNIARTKALCTHQLHLSAGLATKLCALDDRAAV